MNNFNWVRSLQESAFDFLVSHKHCSTHKLVHAGRYAYALSAGVSLGKPRESLNQIFSFLLSQIDDSGKFPIIFPGNLERRNYSTDAIDLGITVDSISRYWSQYPPTLEHFQKISTLVDGNLCRLVERGGIPNQRLWATLGLAKFSNLEGVDSEKREKYRNLCVASVSTFLASIAPDGFTPYYARNSYLNSHSPYYHSRCLAFSLEIFDVLDLRFSEEEFEKLVSAVEYMIRIHGQNGLKNSLLDSKRYYFLESQESYSQIFDFFVLKHPKISVRNLSGAFQLSQSISNNLEILARELFGTLDETLGKTQLSWQCEYMGISYLAWLGYLFPQEAKIKLSPKTTPVNPPSSGQSIYKISCEPSPILHLVADKSPLGFATGGIASGVIFSEGIQGSFKLASRLPLQFSQFSFNPRTFRVLLSQFWEDMPIIRLLVKELLIDRRNFYAFKILARQFLVYSLQCFQVSTKFVTKLNVKVSGSNRLSFPLYLSNIQGHNQTYLGTREIEVTNSYIAISDYLIPSQNFRKVELDIPEQLRSRVVYVKH